MASIYQEHLDAVQYEPTFGWNSELMKMLSLLLEDHRFILLTGSMAKAAAYDYAHYTGRMVHEIPQGLKNTLTDVWGYDLPDGGEYVTHPAPGSLAFSDGGILLIDHYELSDPRCLIDLHQFEEWGTFQTNVVRGFKKPRNGAVTEDNAIFGCRNYNANIASRIIAISHTRKSVDMKLEDHG